MYFSETAKALHMFVHFNSKHLPIFGASHLERAPLAQPVLKARLFPFRTSLSLHDADFVRAVISGQVYHALYIQYVIF